MTVRKILHAADIHLDSPLQKLDLYENAPVDVIRGASRRALENMVQLAIDQSVDLVVIAGDLYDGDWPDQNTGLFFVSQAARLVDAAIPLVVIRGNHDAANVMTATLPLPANPDGSEIMLRADKVDCRVFESIGVAVHGRSFRSRAETENLALTYPKPLAGMFNLGLLHTSLTGGEGHEPYAPCTPAQLADKRYDYWALGHIHTRAECGLEGAAPVVFSGNIQGRHIRETGEKGCVIVEADSRGGCTTRFHPLDVARWHRCTIDAHALTHFDELIDEYESRLREQLAVADHRLLVVRVEIVGATPLHPELHRRSSNLRASLRATTIHHGGRQAWLENVRLHTKLPAATQPHHDYEGPLESLTSVVEELKRDGNAEVVVREELRGLLKQLPPEIDVGGEALPLHDAEWIRELIDSATADILGRLRQPEESAR